VRRNPLAAPRHFHRSQTSTTAANSQGPNFRGHASNTLLAPGERSVLPPSVPSNAVYSPSRKMRKGRQRKPFFDPQGKAIRDADPQEDHPRSFARGAGLKPEYRSASGSTKSPLRNSSTACSCATGSSPATTVATITSQRLFEGAKHDCGWGGDRIVPRLWPSPVQTVMAAGRGQSRCRQIDVVDAIEFLASATSGLTMAEADFRPAIEMTSSRFAPS